MSPSVAASCDSFLQAGKVQSNSALLTDVFSSLRCACGAAKRER
jgi:hypothetical protein